MKKRKIKIFVSVIAGCLLLIVALFFIPIPQEITVEFTAAVVTSEGDILEMTDITYTEDVLNYLLRGRKEDKVRFYINTDNSDWNFPNYQSFWKFGDLYDRFHPDVAYISVDGFIFSKDFYVDSRGVFAASLEHGYFIAGKKGFPDKFLIGSTNESIDSSAVLDFFSEWIDLNFPED